MAGKSSGLTGTSLALIPPPPPQQHPAWVSGVAAEGFLFNNDAMLDDAGSGPPARHRVGMTDSATTAALAARQPPTTITCRREAAECHSTRPSTPKPLN
jgi:hypothetical protein